MVNAGTLMLRWTSILCNLLYLIIVVGVHRSLGGTCWEYIDSTTNLCKKAYRPNMTYEECCGIQGSATVSWTPHDITSDIFYWNFLSKGANNCHRCNKNCSAVVCGKGKACRMVDGIPTCVCKPHCDKTLKSRGALCGSDGRKYRNYCALQRHNCVAEQHISVEYYGKCRNSCKRVECEAGTHCLQDQNGAPHCVRCSDHCNMVLPDNPAEYMCGENGKTYRNTCELKADICRTGRSIRISYSGKCHAHETCKTVACPWGTTCLVSAVSGKPVCMNCAAQCRQTFNLHVCGTDKQTYSSYCQMVKWGCTSGIFVSAHRRGPCKRREKRGHAKLKSKNGFEIRLRKVSKKERKRKMRRYGNKRRHKKGAGGKDVKVHHRVVSPKFYPLSDKRKNRQRRRRQKLSEETTNTS